jgi:hypothetical protein
MPTSRCNALHSQGFLSPAMKLDRAFSPVNVLPTGLVGMLAVVLKKK